MANKDQNNKKQSGSNKPKLTAKDKKARKAEKATKKSGKA